ncbi:MAG: 50S ribosomal protein L32 [Epsilonproteobacteria bacterium]|nr:50S ribosomal protein L32 [Campylobacterota bacterium]
MPVPKRKVSRSRRDKRSANKGLSYNAASVCQTCQSPVNPHQICYGCGYYKGRKVLRTKTDRMYERGQARQAQRDQGQAAGLAAESVQEPTSSSSEE